MDTKLIAYYLPQFHETKENNEWWGKGYTEWRNAKMAVPLFRNHYQPREPLNDFYYDLLDVETMRWQAKLAKKYGIYGFAFYHYWFGEGRKILEKPAENLLAHKDIEMRFCFSWANENWTKTWEGPGGEKQILMQQVYGTEEDWKLHFDYLLPFFQDRRYIKKNGKPVLLIYRLDKIPCYKEMFAYWQQLAKEAGLKGIYIIQMYYQVNQKRRGVDAYTYYVPAAFWGLKEMSAYEKLKNMIRDKVNGKKIPFFLAKKVYEMYDYDKSYCHILRRKYAHNEYMGVFTDFDNTARRGKRAAIWYHVHPKKFQKYLLEVIRKSKKDNKEFVFITAWNEWGEGNYLEPDKRYGYTWLNAVRKALLAARKG